MTGLFEMHVRVGNDPRGFAEFLVLRDELANGPHAAAAWATVGRMELATAQRLARAQ